MAVAVGSASIAAAARAQEAQGRCNCTADERKSIRKSNMTLIEKAFLAALEAHEGQERKDGPPFIVHPVMVTLILAQHGAGERVLAAALTHDVLEDTRFGEDRLRKELGNEVFFKQSGFSPLSDYSRALSCLSRLWALQPLSASGLSGCAA